MDQYLLECILAIIQFFGFECTESMRKSQKGYILLHLYGINSVNAFNV